MPAFSNLYRHGFARAGIYAPVLTSADPKANREAILALLDQAHNNHCALALFPELSLTGYALDDLHHQRTLLDRAEAELKILIEDSRTRLPVIIVGLPVRVEDQVFNCAAVIHRGTLLGLCVKSYLPNYREYYEKRWFSDISHLRAREIRFAGQTVAIGADLIFQAEDIPDLRLFVEICEDLWSPISPSLYGALAGASIIANPSASNIIIGKSDERHLLVDAQSRKAMAAYLYSASGFGESSNDVAWDGQLCAYEIGTKLGESERFQIEPTHVVVDIDLERITQERLRLSSFKDNAAREHDRLKGFRRINFTLNPPREIEIPLKRDIDRFPFVPNDLTKLDSDCYEAYNIQVQALAQRLKMSGIKRAVIGVSGGLDSTQALLVTTQAFDRLGLERKDIIAVTLPGFATSAQTKAQAIALIEGLGVTFKEIDIRPAARQMLDDLDHPYSEGHAQYDITFENVQAGLRTDYLFRLANHLNGLVIGTGDLSELALGWCTYGVGDHMSHYTVNSGVAKTLIQHLIRWCAHKNLYGEAVSQTLLAILETEISPELVPVEEGAPLQSTQDKIGPYPLQDFNLHYAVRTGFGPQKIAFLAHQAWGERQRGHWPPHMKDADKIAYDLETLLKWLEVFIWRFYQTSQFKRTCVPNGPKVSAAGALSPRGDWRAPSDSSSRIWMEELKALKAELGL
ncbi:NAD(+) synthase [Woodsholea maritima]|uniref:NAD(+) synthase n=1 Tax=Woodsholea maritima TaxID=240237 RepID=UPI00037AC9B4|nr:NAD(+) synthase [Woodsholea maritima]